MGRYGKKNTFRLMVLFLELKFFLNSKILFPIKEEDLNTKPTTRTTTTKKIMKTTTWTKKAPLDVRLKTTNPNLWIKGVQKYKSVLDKRYKTMFLNAQFNYMLKQKFNNKQNLTYRH